MPLLLLRAQRSVSTALRQSMWLLGLVSCMESKFCQKPLYSWEILFIINIYVTTPLRAKHMFTFLQCVFLRDSAGQMFLQEHWNCFQLCSIYPCNISKSLRRQMLPHIPLFTRNMDAFCFSWEYVSGRSDREPVEWLSHPTSPTKEHGFGVEKRSEEFWGMMSKNRVSPIEVTALCSVLQIESVALTWGKPKFLPHLLICRAILPLGLLSWCSLSVKFMSYYNPHPLWQ